MGDLDHGPKHGLRLYLEEDRCPQSPRMFCFIFGYKSKRVDSMNNDVRGKALQSSNSYLSFLGI